MRRRHLRRPAVFILATLFTLLPPAPARGADLASAPDITLTDLHGAKTRIDYKGAKVTLVNFWATWCGPCREEMPMIAKLYGQHGPSGFKAVGITVESGGVDQVLKFLRANRDFGINYQILLGDDDSLEKFGDVATVPTTFLFDSNGKVIKRYNGVTSNFYEKVSAEIGKHLALAAAPPKTAPAPSD